MGRKKKVNRKYKDTLFRLIFGNDRNELLSLYNAVNDTDYTNADDLTVNTLADAIYVGMKNDVSFVFQDDLNLYEHQSTLNPNIPLRDLFYVTDLLHGMVDELSVYGSKRLTIPTPRFVMFYNGTKDTGAVKEYRLSEMFANREAEPQLELVVKIININDGQDNKVMKKCRSLREYARLVAMIRENRKIMDYEKAVAKAVNDCNEQGLLRELFSKYNMRIIMKSMLYEYGGKKLREFDREEGREEERIILIQKKVAKGKNLDVIADELESSVEEIRPIYDVVVKYPSDTPDEIFAKL